MLWETAQVYKAAGSFDGAAAVLSRIITEHPTYEHMDRVIWTAAVILRHLEQYAQSLQYMMYVLDDPPVSADGKKKKESSLINITV